MTKSRNPGLEVENYPSAAEAESRKREIKEDNMINAIGEATVQQHIRTSHNVETLDKHQEIQKTDKIKRQRPVEESDDGQKPEMAAIHAMAADWVSMPPAMSGLRPMRSDRPPV